jgi:hypothetical protein
MADTLLFLLPQIDRPVVMNKDKVQKRKRKQPAQGRKRRSRSNMIKGETLLFIDK